VKQPRIVPNLWFDTEAEEAAKFYVSVFKNSRLVSHTRYTEGAPREAGTVMTVEFELDGQHFVGINGGPQFTFDEAISFQITCKDQDEVDYYWEKLTSGGGLEGPCGWLKDRFGVSWQVVPTGMDVMLSDPDPARSQRAMEAMLKMRKLDIAELERAAAGPEAEETYEVEEAPVAEADNESEPEAEADETPEGDDEPAAENDEEKAAGDEVPTA
jgi:predicted 3-demethylubiquinone-9 3-methyltransferase (glyoxalase superfamily)